MGKTLQAASAVPARTTDPDMLLQGQLPDETLHEFLTRIGANTELAASSPVALASKLIDMQGVQGLTTARVLTFTAAKQVVQRIEIENWTKSKLFPALLAKTDNEVAIAALSNLSLHEETFSATAWSDYTDLLVGAPTPATAKMSREFHERCRSACGFFIGVYGQHLVPQFNLAFMATMAVADEHYDASRPVDSPMHTLQIKAAALLDQLEPFDMMAV